MADGSNSLSASWQKAQVIGVIVASLAVPVVVALVGSGFSESQRQRELRIRYVELAVSILKTQPTPGGSALRIWAISVVDHFSPVPLPAEAKKELQFEQLLEDQIMLQRRAQEWQRQAQEMKKRHDDAAKSISPIR